MKKCPFNIIKSFNTIRIILLNSIQSILKHLMQNP